MTEATVQVPGCKHCGQPLVRKSRGGPAPSYCSAVCRARAKDERDKTNGKYEAFKAKLRAATAARREANAKPCPYCGDPMAHPRRVQCGKPECKRLWTNERMSRWQQDRKAKTGQWYGRTFTYERICEHCGESWITVNAQARFCSTACANRTRSYLAACQECGQAWSATRPEARWCTPRCKQAAHDQAEKERQRTAWLPVPATMTWCPIPARHPVRSATAGPRLFVQGNCIRCGAPFCVQSERGLASYCSLRCLKADDKAKRRALKRNAYVAHVYRSRIFERDKWTCMLCGKKTKKDESVPHPLAPVLDHIVPLSKGGTHEPANVQCAHFLCNSTKSDRGGGEQLMLIG